MSNLPIETSSGFARFMIGSEPGAGRRDLRPPGLAPRSADRGGPRGVRAHSTSPRRPAASSRLGPSKLDESPKNVVYVVVHGTDASPMGPPGGRSPGASARRHRADGPPP